MISLRQTVSLKQTLKLSQILSPKLIQILKHVGYSYSDILNRVSREVEENVVLEIRQYDQLMDYSASRKSHSSQDLFGGDISVSAKAKADSDHLISFLESQLGLESLDPHDEEMTRYLISYIDDRGYIENYVEARDEMKVRFNIDDRKVRSLLRIIQGLEPDGVGARSVKECLMIQIDAHHFDHERLRDVFKVVVNDHLDALGAGDFKSVARAMDLEIDGVQALAEFIRNNLNPYPGLAYNQTASSALVIPSFEVKLDGETIDLINLEATKGVQVGVSDQYLKMNADPNLDAETRAYIETRIQKANELIETIQTRQRMMLSLVQLVMARQVEFLKHGMLYLVPLLQKELASELGMSPSTVSRIVSLKYIITPHGVVTLKTLCPRSHFGMTAHRLGQLVGEICSEFPLYSDRKIAEVLAGRGVPIARRTVAKYRQLSGVVSSYRRDLMYLASIESEEVGTSI